MKKDAPVPIRKDPVCGMLLSQRTAAFELQHPGKTYYFCAAGASGIQRPPTIGGTDVTVGWHGLLLPAARMGDLHPWFRGKNRFREWRNSRWD